MTPAHVSGWPCWRATYQTSAGPRQITYWRPDADAAQAHAELHAADLRSAGLSVYSCDVEQIG